MSNEKIKVMGIGFVCMDIIKASEVNKIQLGGTTGNVVSILSKLNISTSVFIPNYSDDCFDRFRKEISNNGVNVIHFADTSLKTPRVIEILNNENKHHTFLTTCPKCNQKLNGVILPNNTQIMSSSSLISNSNVLYFDRVSTGVKKAIEIARESNVWIFYEPNSCRFYNQVLTVSKTVDILKFSDARVSGKYTDKFREDLRDAVTKLIIVSLGNNGLKYCYKFDGINFSDWKFVYPTKVFDVIDTAGAGDWLTAAFLYFFIKRQPNRSNIQYKSVEESLEKAQEMASFSCGFIGAQEVFNNIDLLDKFNNYFNMKIRINPKIEIDSFSSLNCNFCDF